MGRGIINSLQSQNRRPLLRPGSDSILKAGRSISLSKPLLLTAVSLLLVFGVAGADFKADSSDIEWIEPFNPDTTDMPQHYNSGSSLPFIVDVKKDFSNSPEDLVWYRKRADESTWTEFESENMRPEWDHDAAVSSDADLSAQTFLVDDLNQDIDIEEGQSQTITVDGDEVTIGVSTVDTGQDPTFVGFTVDGTLYGLKVGEYYQLYNNNYIRVLGVTDSINSNFVDFGLYNSEVAPEDDNWEYKVTAATDTDEFYHSDSLYFDVSGFNNENLPYVENVTVDGQRIYDFESISGIDPGSTITVDVIEREGDSYNVYLEDRDIGIDVQRQSVNEDGQLEDAYSVVLDFFIDPFIDTEVLKGDNSKRLKFKILPEERTEGVDLFGKDGTYNFGFRVEESTAIYRDTTDFSLTTTNTSVAPNITNVEGSEDCNSYESLTSFDSYRPFECIRVTATDDNTDELFLSMNLTEVYDGIDRNNYTVTGKGWDERNGDQYIFNLSNIDVPTDSVDASGQWRAEFIASDGIENDTETVTWSVPWGDLRVERTEPSPLPFTVFNNESFSNSYRIACSGGPECVNQNESVSLYWDPKPVQNTLLGVN